MRVFVAGGTGVLGRASVAALVEAGHQVRATARGPQKAALVRSLGAEPVDVDLYDAASLRPAVAGSEAVLRLTTKIGSLAQIRSARAWTETNRLRTVGASLLVDAAIAEGASIYVHESICFVYHDGGVAWLAEDAPLDDAGSDILRAAIEGEQQAARFTSAGGRGIVLRFSGLYGVDAPSTLEMIQMARKHLLVQTGPGNHYFSSLWLPDAGRAVAAALHAAPGIYNVSDDEPVLFADYLAGLARAVGVRKPWRLPGWLGKVVLGAVGKYVSRSLRISNASFKTASGWKPSVTGVVDGWPLAASMLAQISSGTSIGRPT